MENKEGGDKAEKGPIIKLKYTTVCSLVMRHPSVA